MTPISDRYGWRRERACAQVAEPSGPAIRLTPKAKTRKLAAALARSAPMAATMQVDLCRLPAALATWSPEALTAVLCSVEKPC